MCMSCGVFLKETLYIKMALEIQRIFQVDKGQAITYKLCCVQILFSYSFF